MLTTLLKFIICHFLTNAIYVHMFSFLQAVADPSILEECGLDEKTKTVLLENIQQKLTQQAVKIRADVEVACYTYEGIDAVKEALR